MKAFPITVKIYADDEQEAQLAQRALGKFVDDMGAIGIAVRGNRIADGVARWDRNSFVKSRIIEHFK